MEDTYKVGDIFYSRFGLLHLCDKRVGNDGIERWLVRDFKFGGETPIIGFIDKTLFLDDYEKVPLKFFEPLSL